MKHIGRFLIGSFVVLLGTTMTSCNSNDDFGTQAIEIPGVTIDGDIDCCSAEEALQVYRFLQTVKIIPELSTVVDGQYNVFAYSKTGTFHTGYNEIFFVATKKKNGNYIKNYDITGIAPQMLMVKMNMKHSTPVGGSAESFDENRLAVKRTWVSFVMNSRKSFKAADDTYYLSLVNPTDWQTGKNTVTAYVSKKNTPATTPYSLAQEQLTIEIDPRMPDMGNHTSPDNTPLTRQTDGSYQGHVNLTMTGRWRIHLTIRDAAGNVVAGGDEAAGQHFAGEDGPLPADADEQDAFGIDLLHALRAPFTIACLGQT